MTRVAAPVAQQLIDAAVEVIDERGEVGLRVQEIVETVGVQIPVLYRHFGNREGLIHAAQVARLQRDLDHELALFDAAVATIATADDFRNLIDEMLTRIASPSRRLMRWKRVSILGSTCARPELAASVADVQREAVRRIADVFRRPRAHGWVRADLDTEGFAAWFAGQAISRIIVELGDTDAENATTEAFDRLWADAIRHTLFG